jgi:hypothetical protein
VITRRLIFLAAIFMLSTSASARLSAAVAATMSIPMYENRTLVNVVLPRVRRLAARYVGQQN